VNPNDRSSGQSRGQENWTDLGFSAEDAGLLAELSVMIDVMDPVPDDLAARTCFAMDLETLDFEVAQWMREDQLAGVRGAATQRTVTFTVDDLTVMVSLAPDMRGNRMDGWLVPGGPHRIEVRVDGYDATTTADDGGRFVLSEVPHGMTQILIHLTVAPGQKSRTVITPTIVL
jgi:hypothetical protein